MSEGYWICLLLLDLHEGFDTEDHQIMCDKLKAMGLRSVEWLYSYLTGRSQVVDVNGHTSKLCTITCGMPQGSILGHLLCLFYVNDMPILVSCKLLHADNSILGVTQGC